MPTLRDPASAAEQVRHVLHAVRRRLLAASVLRGVVAGGLMASLIALFLMTMAGAAWRTTAIGAGLTWFTLTVIRTRAERTDMAAAVALERAYPSLRNLAVTAVELLVEKDRVPPYMWNRVMRAAAQSLAGVDPTSAVPLRARAAQCIAVTVAAAVLLAFDWTHIVSETRTASRPGVSQEAIKPGDLAVDVVPPSYTGRAAVHLRNPASIEALAGSVATIRVAGTASLSVRVNGAAVAPSDASVRTTLAESGSIAIDAGSVHRLLPLTVTPDVAPEVRVTAPGKDLRVADAKATIPIHASAADDIGLREFELRYTIVSGGGEQFSFKEGTLPATVSRDSPRAWTAGTSLSLAALKLEPGDALIYRAVAADARPGAAGEASSDTYFVEVAGPGDIALEGVDMPPDRERYALSQAMVVLKIQRLIARESGMPRAAVEEAAAGIAAEQRAVRANFIFLLGGEVEDEVVEAEESHEIQEGRLANQSRREIVAATLEMRKVEQALAAVSTRAALPPAQAAVRALQRAFGRSRYLLRALPARVRLDPARRLSGDLASARDWSLDAESVGEDRAAAASRRAVGEAAAIAARPSAADARARLERLAEDVLAIAPGAADLQDSARRLLQARDLLDDAVKARAALQEAIAPLLARAQRDRVNVPAVTRDAARLAGAAARGGAR